MEPKGKNSQQEALERYINAVNAMRNALKVDPRPEPKSREQMIRAGLEAYGANPARTRASEAEVSLAEAFGIQDESRERFEPEPDVAEEPNNEFPVEVKVVFRDGVTHRFVSPKGNVHILWATENQPYFNITDDDDDSLTMIVSANQMLSIQTTRINSATDVRK